MTLDTAFQTGMTEGLRGDHAEADITHDILLQRRHYLRTLMTTALDETGESRKNESIRVVVSRVVHVHKIVT